MEDGAPVPGDLGLAKFLFTDASCRRRRQGPVVAAYAAMLVAGDRSRMCSGVIHQGTADTAYCELVAVEAALEDFVDRGELERGDRVFAFMDNQQALNALKGIKQRRDPDNRIADVCERVWAIVAEMGLQVTYSWVPAHQQITETHDWRGLVHCRVDREARRAAYDELERRFGPVEAKAT